MYDHDGRYQRRLAEFFAEGVRDGVRVAYVSRDGATTDLAGVADLDRLLAAGTLQILPAGDVYGAGDPVDPERVVAFFAAETEQAVVDGYRGLRVSADASDMVRTPAQRDAFARCEFLVDGYMADHPLSGLCGFRVDLGDDTLAEFASLHERESSGEPQFQLFGCADGAIGLAGEFDPAGVAALGRLMPRLRADPAGPLVVDLAEVEYVDHRLLWSLGEVARASGVELALRSPPPFTAQLMGLLPKVYVRHGWAVEQS